MGVRGLSSVECLSRVLFCTLCHFVHLLVCLVLAGSEMLRPQRRSLASSSTSRLLSLAEAQERERAQSASEAYFEVGGGPSALPTKYHTVVELPNKSVLVVSAIVSASQMQASCSDSRSLNFRHSFSAKFRSDRLDTVPLFFLLMEVCLPHTARSDC